MSYLTAGSGTPFLMIHGLMSNALDFCFQFQAFENRFNCIAPDLRGAGMTSPSRPESASLDQAIEDMLEFITELIPIDRKIVLLGHSFGGIISLELVKRIPERIHCVIIVSSPAAISSRFSSKLGVFLLKSFFPFLRPFSTNRSAIHVYSHFINMNPFSLNNDNKFVLKKRNSLIKDDDLVYLKGYFESVMQRRNASLPHEYDKPALLLYGDRDILFSGKDVRALKDCFPSLEIFKMNGTGHSCMLEDPGVFNSQLDEFFYTNNI